MFQDTTLLMEGVYRPQLLTRVFSDNSSSYKLLKHLATESTENTKKHEKTKTLQELFPCSSVFLRGFRGQWGVFI